MTIDERRKRALVWLEDVYSEYKQAGIKYRVFSEVNKMFGNPKLIGLDNTFHAWMFDVYTDSIALAVRRQVEPGKYPNGKSRNIISLRALLEELANYPEIITRDYYRSLGNPRPAGVADAEFDNWVGVGEAQIIKSVVEGEIQELEKVSDIVRRYVNRTIAHKSQNPPTDIPSHEDIDGCFKGIAKLIARYYLLMKSTSIGPAEPHPDSPLTGVFRKPTEEEMIMIPLITSDWKGIFRIPWLHEKTP